MTGYVKALGDASHVYHREAQSAADSLRSRATIDAEGVIRWDSNQQVPPEDCLDLAQHIGLPINRAACDATAKADRQAFFAAYRQARRNRTPEQIAEEAFEARAAHGPGVKLVNIITGEEIET